MQPFSRTARRALIFDGLLCLLILLEACFVLYFNKGIIQSQTLSTGGHFLAAFLTGVLVLIRFYGQQVSYQPYSWRDIRHRAAFALPVFLLGTVLLALMLHAVFQDFPVDARFSDVIPTIEKQVNRLLAGEYVYQPIDDWGYHLNVTYLPMQWLPYCVAAWLHIDYRWITLTIWFLAGWFLLSRTAGLRSLSRSLVACLLLLIQLWMILQNNSSILGATVELMVAGYYMLFICGISQRNPWIRGLFISFCLLSRFSLVLWLPLWVLTEFISGDRKDLLRSLLFITGFVLLVYVVPFLSKDWGSFYRGYQTYSTAALGEWQHMNEFGKPVHLYNGLGFAWLFYQKLPPSYSLADRLQLLQRTHFLLTAGSVVLMAVWYWFHRHRIHYRIFLLGSFKIYLAVFLAFIQVPYAYLMITGSFVSIALLAELWHYKTKLTIPPDA